MDNGNTFRAQFEKVQGARKQAIDRIAALDQEIAAVRQQAAVLLGNAQVLGDLADKQDEVLANLAKQEQKKKDSEIKPEVEAAFKRATAAPLSLVEKE